MRSRKRFASPGVRPRTVSVWSCIRTRITRLRHEQRHALGILPNRQIGDLKRSHNRQSPTRLGSSSSPMQKGVNKLSRGKGSSESFERRKECKEWSDRYMIQLRKGKLPLGDPESGS